MNGKADRLSDFTLNLLFALFLLELIVNVCCFILLDRK
jgi:hypothetical protein